MNSKSLTELLPAKHSGWKTANEDNFYDNESLYNYIDGGAELYLSYGFNKVISRNYIKPGQPEIRVDVFDMIKPRNAYGVYTHSREKIENNFGQGSQTLIGAVLFWKDMYYVSVISQSETDEVTKAIHGIARIIDSSIPGKGKIPGVVKLLPEDNLVAESVTYFHHPVWLNYFAWLFEDNYLNITKETRSVWAKYETTRKRAMLLLVQYPDEHTARLGFNSFTKYFFPNAGNEMIKRDKNNRWIGCRVKEDLFAAVFNAPVKDIATSLLDQVYDKSEE
jgi:hypothetical protein